MCLSLWSETSKVLYIIIIACVRTDVRLLICITKKAAIVSGYKLSSTLTCLKSYQYALAFYFSIDRHAL